MYVTSGPFSKEPRNPSHKSLKVWQQATQSPVILTLSSTSETQYVYWVTSQASDSFKAPES